MGVVAAIIFGVRAGKLTSKMHVVKPRGNLTGGISEEKEREIKQLQDKNSSLENNIEKLQEKNSSLEKQLEKLLEKIENLTAAFESKQQQQNNAGQAEETELNDKNNNLKTSNPEGSLETEGFHFPIPPYKAGPGIKSMDTHTSEFRANNQTARAQGKGQGYEKNEGKPAKKGL